jgi:putative membrane protein
MSTRAFFDDAAKSAVRAAIERVERQTCAEVVVAVRRQAGISYREADLGFGAVVGVLTLTCLLFVDKEFATTWIPLDVAIAFGAGALLCRYSLFLRRLLTPAHRRREETRRAASAAFHDMGIGRTSGRHGILVLVGLFERKVVVIPDVGIDPMLLRDPIARIERAVERANPDLAGFVAGLDAIGPALGPTMPCGPDDVNELPDDVGHS